jgi:Undecaprenyl-phosphate glucose phosphotransferase
LSFLQKGAPVSDNSVVRPLFLDGDSGFALTGDRQTRRPARLFSILAFVYAALLLDFGVLLALNILLARSIFVSSTPAGDEIIMSLCFTTIILILFNRAKLHRIEVIGNFTRYARRFQKIWLTSFVIVLAAAATFSLPAASRVPDLSRFYGLWIGLWFVTGWIACITARYALIRSFRYCTDQGFVAHEVVVVGATELAEQFIERVKADALGVRVSAIFDDNAEAALSRTIADVPILGNIDDLLFYNKHHEIDTVVITLPHNNNEPMRRLIQRLSFQPLRITMLPGTLALEMSPDWCAPVGDVPGIHLMEIMDLPIDRFGRIFKGVLDKIVAAFALILFAPLMLACVIGIKLASPGPVLFRQKRIGYRNREFEMFKFRSMHVSRCNTGVLTARNDPRVFGFGQIMRKLSFDELPQLFNVLIGDMSLVGPRPHMPEARACGQLYVDAILEYAARHRVKPGITGWAQVNGWRGPTDTVAQLENRVMHDLYYINNWSIELDMKILVKTIFVGFFGKNAF